MRRAGLILIGIVYLAFASRCLGQDSERVKSFPQKLVFSETPEIGRKWHGGIRTADLLAWEAYININDWFLVDLLTVGLPNFLKAEGGNLVDKFSAFTIKSMPVADRIMGHLYQAGGGIKLYAADFSLSDSTNDTLLSAKDGSLVAFVSQSLALGSRHYLNLFSSLSGRSQKLSTGGTKTKSTYYLVPGYRFRISKNWGACIEYYMTNTEQFPIKVLQYAFDEDGLDFYNPERYMYSFMVWGFQYRREHFYWGLTLANHSSFTGPIVPLLGIGWDF